MWPPPVTFRIVSALACARGAGWAGLWVLLLLVAIFGSGTVKLAQNTTIELHPSLGLAFLAGLVWGTLLGAFGGLLTLRSIIFSPQAAP